MPRFELYDLYLEIPDSYSNLPAFKQIIDMKAAQNQTSLHVFGHYNHVARKRK